MFSHTVYMYNVFRCTVCRYADGPLWNIQYWTKSFLSTKTVRGKVLSSPAEKWIPFFGTILARDVRCCIFSIIVTLLSFWLMLERCCGTLSCTHTQNLQREVCGLSQSVLCTWHTYYKAFLLLEPIASWKKVFDYMYLRKPFACVVAETELTFTLFLHSFHDIHP